MATTTENNVKESGLGPFRRIENYITQKIERFSSRGSTNSTPAIATVAPTLLQTPNADATNGTPLSASSASEGEAEIELDTGLDFDLSGTSLEAPDSPSLLDFAYGSVGRLPVPDVFENGFDDMCNQWDDGLLNTSPTEQVLSMSPLMLSHPSSPSVSPPPLEPVNNTGSTTVLSAPENNKLKTNTAKKAKRMKKTASGVEKNTTTKIKREHSKPKLTEVPTVTGNPPAPTSPLSVPASEAGVSMGIIPQMDFLARFIPPDSVLRALLAFSVVPASAGVRAADTFAPPPSPAVLASPPTRVVGPAPVTHNKHPASGSHLTTDDQLSIPLLEYNLQTGTNNTSVSDGYKWSTSMLTADTPHTPLTQDTVPALTPSVPPVHPLTNLVKQLAARVPSVPASANFESLVTNLINKALSLNKFVRQPQASRAAHADSSSQTPNSDPTESLLHQHQHQQQQQQQQQLSMLPTHTVNSPLQHQQHLQQQQQLYQQQQQQVPSPSLANNSQHTVSYPPMNGTTGVGVATPAIEYHPHTTTHGLPQTQVVVLGPYQPREWDDMKGGGSSCHQCKTRFAPNLLVYCGTSQADQARRRRKRKRDCRKKYCHKCMARFYHESAQCCPPDWACPGCRGICTCAECKRKRGDSMSFNSNVLPHTTNIADMSMGASGVSAMTNGGGVFYGSDVHVYNTPAVMYTTVNVAYPLTPATAGNAVMAAPLYGVEYMSSQPQPVVL